MCYKFETPIDSLGIKIGNSIMEISEFINELHEIKKNRISLQNELDTLKAKEFELERLIRSKMDVNDEFENLSEEEFQLAMADMVSNNIINVEVVYALKDMQTIKEIQVPRGASIDDCIATSSILSEYPEIDLSVNKVGIHGTVKPLAEVVREGDRVEIYRQVTAKT